MYISNELLNNLANYCKNNTVGIVLVNSSNTVVADMTNTTDTVSWDTTQIGKLQLLNDVNYDVSAGSTVAGWRAVNSSDLMLYGGNLPSPVSFDSSGQFNLSAQGTYFLILAAT